MMNSYPSVRRQQGMVLVVCLIMLLLLTLSGLAAMQGSTMQEKMAGNSRDGEQAFLAAEAALRGGEAYMASVSGATATFDTTGTAGLYDVATSGVTVDWQSASTNWRNGASLTGVAVTPKYLVEKLPEVINKGLSLEADQPLNTMIIYRITASAVGQTTTSRAVLQSTFRR
jgi:type IV pilus assembly protein PilX